MYFTYRLWVLSVLKQSHITNVIASLCDSQ